MQQDAKRIDGEGEIYNNQKRLAHVRFYLVAETATTSGAVSVTGRVATIRNVDDLVGEGVVTLHMEDGRFLDFYAVRRLSLRMYEIQSVGDRGFYPSP